MNRNPTLTAGWDLRQRFCKPALPPACVTVGGHTPAAIYGPQAGLERYLRRCATCGANGVVHCPPSAATCALLLMPLAAIVTARGLVGETLLGVESLFASSEHELRTTITAGQNLVLVSHQYSSPFSWVLAVQGPNKRYPASWTRR